MARLKIEELDILIESVETSKTLLLESLKEDLDALDEVHRKTKTEYTTELSERLLDQVNIKWKKLVDLRDKLAKTREIIELRNQNVWA